jgi:superfamily I DNA and/or RNA helicase
VRDGGGVKTLPHVVAHRVYAAPPKNKVNEREAEEITALILAASEQPEYDSKTFGVISMVGDQQAYRIEQMLRTKMSEERFKLKHNILCGNPAHFQGDERDIMFLSIVDTCNDGVLPLREEERFKQRFNVAASRARDQMWVVHSLNPERT